MAPPLVGIFVGGAGRRMGGVAKGLLPAPDGAGSLVERLIRVVRSTLADAEIVLVGDARDYAALGLPSLADAPPGIGPLGGLSALLAEARARGAPFAVALACDLPFVSPRLLTALVTAAPHAPCVAPRQQDRWQPLCARYAPGPALAAAEAALAHREHALWRVLARLEVTELSLSADELGELRDWDEPSDLQ